MFNFLKRNENSRVVGVLDVGSYSTVCLIARLSDTGFKILGAHRIQTKGYTAGVVSNMGELFSCVASAVYETEQKSDHTIKKLFLLAPAQACLFNSIHCKGNIGGGEINYSTLSKLVTLAQEKIYHPNNTPLHISSGSYVVDGIAGIDSPYGLIGEVIESKINIISVQNSLLSNLRHCVKKCHMEVDGIISSLLTPTLACITEEDSPGCVIINIGASCTSICVCKNQNFEMIATIPIGGSTITSDIAKVLNSTFSHAERIKNLHGCLVSNLFDDKESIFVPILGEQMNYVNDLNNNKIPKAKLVSIIQARFEDLANALKLRLKAYLGKYKIIVTGGAAKTPGLKEFLSLQLNVPVRLGLLESLSGSLKESTELASCVGMLNYLIAQKK